MRMVGVFIMNEYIWYTIQSDSPGGPDATFSILPDDKSLETGPKLDKVPAMHIPMAMSAIRGMCLATYNLPAAFKIGYIDFT